MPTQVQFRRGTTAQNNNFTGAAGELSVNTSNNTIRVHDGVTVGGYELAKAGNIRSLFVGTSADVAAVVSDETGSGSLVFGTSPTITTSLTTPSSSFDLINTTATTVNFAKAATTLSIGGSSGTTTVNNGLVVTGDLTVNGTTTTINATTITVDDKNIELGSTASPSDATADGGGITLKGTTDKTFNYINATTAWTSSEDLNLLTGKVYEINGTSVLSSTTLGSGVTTSSLTSVGTLGSLTVTNNVSAGAYLTTGNSTAANFQSTGNVNTASALFTGSITGGTIQTAGNVNSSSLRVTTASSLGTVQSGTWNGSSISTTYTDAKVTSVNGQTGAATGFATTANALSQFASTTSAQLASLISDETGSGSLVFSVSPAFTGTVTAVDVAATGNITAPNLYAYSDEALKTDITQINNAIEKVKALNGVYFTWKNNQQRSMGLIAQQVEPIEPVVVGTTPDGFKSVNYSSLIGLLIEAIKEQQIQIDDLKKQIDNL